MHSGAERQHVQGHIGQLRVRCETLELTGRHAGLGRCAPQCSLGDHRREAQWVRIHQPLLPLHPRPDSPPHLRRGCHVRFLRCGRTGRSPRSAAGRAPARAPARAPRWRQPPVRPDQRATPGAGRSTTSRAGCPPGAISSHRARARRLPVVQHRGASGAGDDRGTTHGPSTAWAHPGWRCQRPTLSPCAQRSWSVPDTVVSAVGRRPRHPPGRDRRVRRPVRAGNRGVRP